MQWRSLATTNQMSLYMWITVEVHDQRTIQFPTVDIGWVSLDEDLVVGLALAAGHTTSEGVQGVIPATWSKGLSCSQATALGKLESECEVALVDCYNLITTIAETSLLECTVVSFWYKTAFLENNHTGDQIPSCMVEHSPGYSGPTEIKAVAYVIFFATP